MRIKSNFRDFYDGVQQYVYGPSSVYTRNWCKTQHDHRNILFPTYNSWRADDTCAIGFCGTIYGFVDKFIREYYCVDECRMLQEREYVWNAEELKKGRRLYTYHSREEKKKMEKIFFVKKDDTIFIKENAPIFFLDRNRSICCPLATKNHVQFDESLDTLRFSSIISPQEAYTSLVDYIGFLGMEHKTLPEMPNDVKIASHGFSKTSFCKKKK